MKTLSKYIRKNGFDYRLELRTAKVAMYAQYEDENVIAYEVGYVKTSKGGEIGGNVIEAGEVFWSNEDFGKVAWVHRDKAKAIALFDELEATPRKAA